MYLPNPSIGCDTRLIFKSSKAGLNLEFFFSSSLVALLRPEKQVLPTI